MLITTNSEKFKIQSIGRLRRLAEEYSTNTGEKMEIYVGRHSPTAARKKKIEHLKPFVMKPKWEPLEKVRETAQNVPGLYMMAFDKPVKYDKGISRVIYIGSAVKLKGRLRSHYNNIKANKKKYGFIYDVTRGDLDKIFACFFKVDVKSKNEILTVEQIAFDEFALKFGVQPLGNWNPRTTSLVGEIILGEQPAQTKSFLEHVEDDSGEYALPLCTFLGMPSSFTF